MIDILVNFDSIEEAIYICKFLYNILPNKGIRIKKAICSKYRCYIQTDKIFITFIVCKNSDIRGKRCDIAYGFNREESLCLTRGKREYPTLPLLDQICQIENKQKFDYDYITGIKKHLISRLFSVPYDYKKGEVDE